MTTDFHSHILPDFDDGAENVDESIKMIKRSREMGVQRIVSTSHCYPTSSGSVDKFLSGRKEAYDKLNAAIINETNLNDIEIVLGCEVHLTGDITKLRNYRELCIDNTDYMLVEMPFSKWTDNTIENVYKLCINGIKPVIAHMERNVAQREELLTSLYELDILVQINAESFGYPPLKKYIDTMMKNKMIHVLGSDMHNLSTRCPNINKAENYIKKRYGNECWDYLMNNADLVLNNKEISYGNLKSFKRKKIFEIK